MGYRFSAFLAGMMGAMLLTSAAVQAGFPDAFSGEGFSGTPRLLTSPLLPDDIGLNFKRDGRRYKGRGTNTTTIAPLDVSMLSEQILLGLRRFQQKRTVLSASVSGLISRQQQTALEKLSSNSEGVRVHFDPRNGTPSFIRFKQPVAASLRAAAHVDGELIANHFLAAQRDLLKLKNPQSEMKLLRKMQSADGRQHLHFQQLWQGVPLWGKQLVVHLNSRNEIYLINGRYESSPIAADSVPLLSADEALSMVLGDLAVSELKVLDNTLVFYVEGSAPRLAYKLDVRLGLDQRWLYFVDARTAALLHRIQNIHAGSLVEARGADVLNGSVRSFTAWRDGNSYFMIDPTRPLNDVKSGDDPVNRPGSIGDTYIFDARYGNPGDGDQLWYVKSGDAFSGWDPVAVSAMHNARLVYDYYLNTFQRKSIDDKQMNLMSVIHFQQDYNNAFWNGAFIVYGDGDNKLFSPLAGCLDVAAHEMTHGVIEHTANLRYENQSGALNESFADFFAAMVDRDDWLMGEDCTLATPGYLRDLRNPANGLEAQPGRMSEYRNLPNTEQGDNGGVHVNSGIPNRAAYLTVEGIGRDKTEQIYYRALTLYLTASSRFIDARRALIQAAEDIHGVDSPEVEAVKAAWDAVEVVEGGGVVPAPQNSAPADTVEGSDLMVYLYPVDGNNDSLLENFVLYRQMFNTQQDEQLSRVEAAQTRPAVFTGKDGTVFLFVGVDANLYGVNVNGVTEQITFTGNIASIAVSPDGRYLAYTSTDLTDNQIHVLDIEQGGLVDYPIVLPDYQQGENASVGMVRYADSLSFDFTGEVILFDMLVCMSQPDNGCRPDKDESGFNYWSIGLLDLKTRPGRFYFPFPAQSPLFDLGYPSFAYNNSHVIAFDLHEYSDQGGIVKSSVVTLDLERQQMNQVVNFGNRSELFSGIPSFWGDDDYITVQWPAGDGTVATRIPLGDTEDTRWQGYPERAEQINDYAVAMPLMHRIGQRKLSRTLQASSRLLDFGSIKPGIGKTMTLELTNVGNTDIEITAIGLRGSHFFAHNGVNTLLSPGSRLPIDIIFTAPAGSSGTYTADLIINSNGTPATLTISATGTINSGSGDGGLLNPVLLLLFAMTVLMRAGFVRKI